MIPACIYVDQQYIIYFEQVKITVNYSIRFVVSYYLVFTKVMSHPDDKFEWGYCFLVCNLLDHNIFLGQIGNQNIFKGKSITLFKLIACSFTHKAKNKTKNLVVLEIDLKVLRLNSLCIRNLCLFKY